MSFVCREQKRVVGDKVTVVKTSRAKPDKEEGRPFCLPINTLITSVHP